MESFVSGLFLGIITIGLYYLFRDKRPTVTVQEQELTRAKEKSDEAIKDYYTAADEFKRKYGQGTGSKDTPKL